MESSEQVDRTVGPRADLDLIAEAARRLAFDRPFLDKRHGNVSFQVFDTPNGARVEYAIGFPEGGSEAAPRSFGAYDLYTFPDPPSRT